MRFQSWGCLVLFLISMIPASGQQCIPLYKHTYGGNGSDEALSVLSTPDRGSLVAGRTTSSSLGSYDGFIMKLSESGEVQWTKNYGGTGYDQITQLFATAGGYIAVAQTASFGNQYGEPLLIKIDYAGNLIWSRTYINDQSASHRISKAILLNDGSIAMLVNLNDSTTQGNALVAKLNANGDVLWAREFDHGNKDFFNYLVQQNDSLVIVGTSIKPDGLTTGTILKLDINTGQTYKSWALYCPKNVSFGNEYENNSIMVGIGAKGIMVTHNFKPIYPNMTPHWQMAAIQIADDGSKIFEKHTEAYVGTSSGDNTTIVAMQGPDHSFMHLYNDNPNDNWGNSRFIRLGGAVNTMHLDRVLYDESFEYTHFSGMDTTGNYGYMFAGYRCTTWPTGQQWKIKVFKTDELLLTGNCPTQGNNSFVQSVSLKIENFNWQSVQNATGITIKDVTVVSANNIFTRTDGCADTYCKPTPVFPQNCLSTFFLNMRGVGLPGLKGIRKTADGSYLAGGSYYWGRQIQPFLTKIRSNGSVEWTRGYINHTDEGMVQRVVPSGDGATFVTISNEGHPDDNHVSDYATIMKVDDDGNVIWHKRLESDVMRHKIQAVVATNDGGVIFTYNTNNASAGSDGCYVIRLDANGNTAWQKKILGDFAGYLGYRELLLDGNDLYLGINAHRGMQHVRVEKWNAQTGQVTWERSIGIEKVDEVDVQGIFKVKDTLYVGFSTRETGGSWGERITIRFAKFLPDGRLFDGFRLREPNFSTGIANTAINRDASPYIGKTNDDAFVIAQQIRTGNVSSLGVIKVNPQGSVVWAKNFKNLDKHGAVNVLADDDNILITGTDIIYQPISTETRRDHSFIMKLNRNGDIMENATGNCFNEPLSISIEPFPVAPPALEIIPSFVDGNVVITNEGREFFAFEIQTSLGCSTADVCTTVSIEGEEKICDVTAEFTYAARRNADCKTPVSWIFDSNLIQKIKETDSTITVKFLQPSVTTSITARLSSGCTGISATKNIQVIKSVSLLALVGDTTLCTGNTILLDAGTGYTSYTWQDGSSDHQFQVTQSGSYWVVVGDECGNTLRKDVLVRPAAAVQVGLNMPTASLCIGDSLKVNAPAGFISYAWSPAYHITNTSGQETFLFPDVDTMYRLTVEREPGCFGVDSIKFSIKHASAINLGNDTSFCTGRNIELDAGSNFISYHWNTGSADPKINVSSAGTYSVSATSADGCKAMDTLIVLRLYPLPVISLDQDPLLCEGSQRVLTAGTGNNTYAWNTGSTASSITVNTVGTYSVRVTTEHGCSSDGSTTISIISPLPKNFLPADTTICSYGTLQLKPTRNFTRYQWSNNAATSSITIQQPGLYWLKVTDANACTGADSILVNPKECLTGLYVPTAFTPNKDGKNDIFQPQIFGNLISYRFAIYNRWGQPVFQTSDRNKGWDGRFGGINQDSNVFTWLCTYQFEGGDKKTEKGTVMLIR